MGQRIDSRVSLPAEHRSVVRARRLVQAALRDAGLDGLAIDAVLLTSELCENAVLHAGTGFELELAVSGDEVTIGVTDRGPTALEHRMGRPVPAGSRAATHGRGLMLVEQIASAWGTRHDGAGHQVWFTLRIPSEQPAPGASVAPTALDRSVPPDASPDGVGPPDTVGPPAGAGRGSADGPVSEVSAPWPAADISRWLLHLPAARTELGAAAVATELTRRLCDVLDAEGAEVWVDYGHGLGERQLSGYGGVANGRSRPVVVPLPLPAPLHGRLVVHGASASNAVAELADLTAQRVGMCVEAEWVRGEVTRRRSWTTYLAETSELLAQSLDMRLTSAIVPQLVVPRLGLWCAVHLVDARGRPALVAATHADEAALPALRDTLAPGRFPELAGLMAAVRRGATAVSGLNSPTPCVVAPLTAHGVGLGVLTVGRPAGRAHSSEEVLLISDVARRAALAIDNARRNAEQVANSQALQQALLPRALPTSREVVFAAAYLPVTRGADVGGDFYDVIELGDGHWIASIGDVCGKGARAAARAGQVRDVLRVLARAGHPLDGALGLLNDVLLDTGGPDQYCTVATTSIRGRPGSAVLELELVLAGHLRPFLVRAGGVGRFVGQVGTAAGLVEDFVVVPESLRLYPGDALVAFTDGVTEHRQGREQFGDERLADVLNAAAGGSATQLVDAVRAAVDRFSDTPQRDDLAVLVIQALQGHG